MGISAEGTGYIELVRGTYFAETSINVTCIDIDKKKIKTLNKHIIPIYEPGLDNIYKNNLAKARFSFTTSFKNSVVDAEAHILVSEWSEFRSPNFRVLEKLVKSKLIFDS